MIRWITGEALSAVSSLASGIVQTVITSPPYFGLRDYSTGSWEGGDPDCDHKQARGTTRGGPHSTITGGQDTTAHSAQYRDTCGKCGAKRIDQQIGLEPSPDEYVQTLVSVFREVRRVMTDDGTLWLNLGDSFASGASGFRPGSGRADGIVDGVRRIRNRNGVPVPEGLKPKDLIGIPWRVAFALQADGWYLRSDIIWHKPNAMPESVTDRPTKSHEHVFLFAKSGRYYYDAEAVKEESVGVWNSARSTLAANGKKNIHLNETGQRRTAGADTFHRDEDRTGRNMRDVWTIPTQPYAGAHYAVFPERLVEPCMKAGSQRGDIVLDPFAGSGTVGVVAHRLYRDAILIDLNPANRELARERILKASGYKAMLQDYIVSGDTDGVR